MKRKILVRGFTLLELLVAMTIISVLASLVLPTIVSQTRESSRKQVCSNNIRLIGLAELEYEQTYKRLSCRNITWGYGTVGSDYWVQPSTYAGAGRWGGFIALLPYMDETSLHAAFNDGSAGYFGSLQKCWGPYGSVASAALSANFHAPADSLRFPWSGEYQPNRTQVGTFRCPSDPGKMRNSSMWNVARTNYAFSLGDGQIGINGGDLLERTTRGAFQRNLYSGMASITDGAANVISFGEIATPESSSFAIENQGVTETDAKTQGRAIYELAQQADFKGIDVTSCRALASDGHYPGTKRNWGNIGMRNLDATANYTGFNTINPPNGGSCTPSNNPWGEGDGIYTASSYHLGGAHTVTFDGTVRFISNEISTIDNRINMTAADYFSPGCAWANGKWNRTSNWEKESPFGVWGAMGTISGNDYGD